ncbi:MAG: alpha/beta hydrolase [Lachnospiraceae bacterium]|nr:alpha/beta hydrolase [Lachnospiraceae bacterium]
MRFLTHGKKTNKPLMLIHGMANTADLFDPLLEFLCDYYVIVCELDGHSRQGSGDFVSVTDSSIKIEKYVQKNLDGKLSGLLGYSLGGTIVTELISRGNIEVERAVMDAAYVIKMGILTCPYTLLFQAAIWCLKKDIHIPKVMVELVMGKGNNRILDTIYSGVSLKTIGNVCRSIYRYEIRDSLDNYRGPVAFWHGEYEPYPVKSARLLKKHLPRMKKRVFKGMGHGQMLHEHPAAYAGRLKAFLEEQG